MVSKVQNSKVYRKFRKYDNKKKNSTCPSKQQLNFVFNSVVRYFTWCQVRCYIQITISEGDTRKILRVFPVGPARKWRFLFQYGGITTRRHQQQYGENWKILNWRRFLELSNWNLKTWPGILERDLSVTLHISAASSFKSLDVMQHTYLTKMFNERVTDAISCVKTIRKHFLEEQLLGEAWINIVSRCYLRWYVIRPGRCCNWFVVVRTEQVSLKSIALVL